MARARRYGAGTIVAGGDEHAVRFVPVADAGLDARIDEAFRRKYAGSPYTQAMIDPPAAGTTTLLELTS